MKYRILLVEDDPSIGSMMLQIFLKVGYEAVLADSFSAVQKLTHFNFSAVVSDFRLLDGDACDVIEFMRKKIPSIPAIVTSGLEWQVAADFETRRITGVTFVSKPFRPMELLESLKGSLVMATMWPEDR